MNEIFAAEIRKTVAEILDQNPLRCNDWPKVQEILRERFTDQPDIVEEFLQEEGQELQRYFTLRGAVHPAYLSRIYSKKTFFLLLDARAIPYPRLQELLKTLRGDVSWYNVYGDKDVVLKCMGAREQVIRFAKETLKTNLVDCDIIEVNEVHRCWGIDIPPRPSIQELKQVEPPRLLPLLKGFNSDDDQGYHQELRDKNILLGPVVIEDTRYTHRIRALVLIGWVGFWKEKSRFPEALRNLDRDDLQITALYGSSEPDCPFLVEIISRDAHDLDMLTDEIAGVHESVRPRTLVIARTVSDPWPTLESVDISFHNARLLAEEAANRGLRDIFDRLSEGTLEAIHRLQPTESLAVIGLVGRLRRIDLSFLQDPDVFSSPSASAIPEKFQFARTEVEAGALEGNYARIDSAMTQLGSALEGILLLALRHLYHELFGDWRFEPRIRGRLNLEPGWWEKDTVHTLGELKEIYARWSRDKVLKQLFPIDKRLVQRIDFCKRMRDRASHFGHKSLAEDLVPAEDAVLQGALLAKEIYNTILRPEKLGKIPEERFVSALVSVIKDKDNQSLPLLLKNDKLDVPINRIVTEVRGKLASEGMDLEWVIKIVDEKEIMKKGDVKEEEKSAFAELREKWQHSGKKALEELPDRVWSSAWKVIQHALTEGDVF